MVLLVVPLRSNDDQGQKKGETSGLIIPAEEIIELLLMLPLQQVVW